MQRKGRSVAFYGGGTQNLRLRRGEVKAASPESRFQTPGGMSGKESNVPFRDESGKVWNRRKPRQLDASRRRTAHHVRRDKAALFQRVQTPPGDRSSRKQPGQAWRRRNV